MNQAQVEEYLCQAAVPSLSKTQPGSIAAWISRPVDLDNWLLLTEFQRKYGLRKRPERKYHKASLGKGKAGTPVKFKGRDYPSIASAARANHIPLHILKSKLRGL